MTVAFEYPQRVPSMPMVPQAMALEDRFEVIKDIGDGSFGSVALARVRTAGASIAKRGTMVAIKTMKKTFDSFASCLELREVIFLRSLPMHVHLVPALDIFLDPTTKKLHICMEYMDGNLYQLMKARDNRYLDGSSVKSILFQILSGLDHIHTNNFFHRDIKPENILISTSSPQDTSHSNFRRYSSLVTPPATPPAYSVKIADFGLARETYSKAPYTTYVSTRWYRAPEVLLRAGEYSAPVDIWALGAMAVEIATLKPLFPGGNEVDQVWRVCEIMGSPGNWYNKAGARVGGGEWRDGVRLAQKLGFSFPKMAPHALEGILPPPQWPACFSQFVTWCLMWDPEKRPTSLQAMNHAYFADAVDPLIRPKSSSRLLGRKHSNIETKTKDLAETGSQRTSWFRKSLIARDSAPAISQLASNPQLLSPGPSPVHQTAPPPPAPEPRARPHASKRATWASGQPASAAPMPILPSIRPISPLSNAVTAQGRTSPPETDAHPAAAAAVAPKKLGRQLSVASNGNHYGDLNAEQTLHGLSSPTSSTHKESFFSHLRKRARRLSGRNQVNGVASSREDEAVGKTSWTSERSAMHVDSVEPNKRNSFVNMDAAPQYRQPPVVPSSDVQSVPPAVLKRSSSLRQGSTLESQSPSHSSTVRNRRTMHLSHPAQRYETPNEEEELLDEALASAHHAAQGLQHKSASYVPVSNIAGSAAMANTGTNAAKTIHRSQSLYQSTISLASQPGTNPYPTPSPSAKRSGVVFGTGLPEKKPTTPVAMPVANSQYRANHGLDINGLWPTPPYEDNEWAASASASIFAAGGMWR